MSDEQGQSLPEILLQIKTAEQEVEAMLRAAERDAATIIESARVEAETLQHEKCRAIEEKKRNALAQGLKEAEREAEHLIENARAKADDLKTRCLGRLDDAAELVLRRVLPAFQRTEGRGAED